jgi:hypothetical protein
VIGRWQTDRGTLAVPSVWEFRGDGSLVYERYGKKAFGRWSRQGDRIVARTTSDDSRLSIQKWFTIASQGRVTWTSSWKAHAPTPGDAWIYPWGRDHEAVPTITPDEDARDRSIAGFRADPKAMMDLVAELETDLFAPFGGSSAPGTTSRLDTETRGRGPARARDGPMRGASLGGTVRTMIWAAPTARIGASAVPRDARSASMTRMTGGRGAPPVDHPPRTGTYP